MKSVDKKLAQELAQKYGYLPYMVERYLSLFKEETEAFLTGNEVSLSKTIRVNELIAPRAHVVERLTNKAIKLEQVPHLPYAFRVLESPLPLGATTEYLLGQYILQSPASIWAVEALNPRGIDTVIDLTAAPGGKTTLIAQLMENQGALFASDISRERIRSLRSNVSRMGVKNTLVMRIDAARLPKMGITADAVLLDAPCTGEGLIPIDPARKRSRTLKDITTLTKVQQKLIEAASELLRERGVMVYSTCSFAPEENEFIINWALNRYPLRIVDPEIPVGEPGFTAPFGQQLDDSLALARRLYPYKHQTEGFFICKLQKNSV